MSAGAMPDYRLLPLADVLAAVEFLGEATVMDVVRYACATWQERATVRNRLEELVELGELIADEGRPVRFAVNQLR